ncbi:MAG: tetratricopeptide repeat protein [Bacteroidia bacterium]|nr:tetratricopeptide repeat protein [Bacteroidia bacterium]MDW8301360.1 tetratricopeptide repeat protein [Bacteroidia bacterium]
MNEYKWGKIFLFVGIFVVQGYAQDKAKALFEESIRIIDTATVKLPRTKLTEIYKQIRTKYPESDYAIFCKAWLKESKKIRDQINDYTAFINKKPEIGLSLAYAYRADLYIEIKEYQKALADLDKAVQLKPDFYFAYWRRGIAYIRMEAYEKAIEDLTQAIKINPKFTGAYCDRGDAYLRLGQTKLAFKDYEKAIQLSPNMTFPYNYRAMAYVELENYKAALLDLNRVLSINKNNHNAYYYRGVCYYDMGEYDKAADDFTMAIQLYPDKPIYYVNRAENFMILKKYQNAIIDAETAYAFDNEDSNPLVIKALAEKKNHNFEEALNTVKKAIEINVTVDSKIRKKIQEANEMGVK